MTQLRTSGRNLASLEECQSDSFGRIMGHEAPEVNEITCESADSLITRNQSEAIEWLIA
jgi:hypothetical protein